MHLSRALPAICLALALAAPARAQGEHERAREAYDKGTAAHKRGDFAEAATDFALADQLAPSTIALRAAIDASVRADDPVLGMELVERSKRGPVDAGLSSSVDAARAKFHGRAGRVRIRCPPAGACMATLDGRTLDVQKEAWATAGQHTVVFQLGEDSQQRLVDVKADDTTDVAPAARAPAPAPSPVPPPGPEPTTGPATPPPPQIYSPPPAERPTGQPSSSGISPVWFWVGTGATVVLGGATAFSALDTSKKHDQFANDGCARAGSAACTTASTDGSAAQLRTNVLLGATAAAAIVTVVIGVAFTRWSGEPSKTTARGAPCGPGGWQLEF
jgi:hypothetical protein